ncbi:methyltransferase [Streptomyces kunmingensis]|uniref:Methyltransferase n=1 Tax=Streptomyces kunmingensis TaxID=68225 RepID=A0ABU6CGT0_9ACTN|nr:HemK2/MTQ2 family protein methyltransferase [Streptomyces kunmingensis]MEB3963926.1 methyltransferase [Streptomyces kunmingensis]
MTTHARPRQPQQPSRGPRLLAPRGVYAPQYDTDLLLRALSDEQVGERTDVLDLGTGTGALAVAAARLGARVTAVDLSWRAVWTARLNARINRTPVTVRHGDLCTAFTPGSFDLIVSNPPYVPAPSAALPRRGLARAWDGGFDGRTVVDRVCDAAPRALRPGGTLLMVHSALCDASASLRRLTANGMSATVIDKNHVPFGPVLRERRTWLCEQGLLDRDATHEELVVIRAELR